MNRQEYIRLGYVPAGFIRLGGEDVEILIQNGPKTEQINYMFFKGEVASPKGARGINKGLLLKLYELITQEKVEVEDEEVSVP